MTQAQTHADTNTSNGNTHDNGQTAPPKAAKTMTAIDAAAKISKILEPLSLFDRKRVLAFVAETGEVSE